jgi:transcriptional regulator GlxA family with amidase domain
MPELSCLVCDAGSDESDRSEGNVTAARPRLAILAAPESSASVLYGLYDVLVSVGAMYPDMLTGKAGDALLDVQIVAASGEPFRCFGNVLVEPSAAVDEVEQIDVVIAADMYAPIDSTPRGQWATEAAWLQRMHAGGALIASVCTGSILLAEAGLLDGRTCASHWAYRDLFTSVYPHVKLLPNAILDLSSEAEGVITAGGVTAWQDLALHLIRRLCGPEHAIRTAKVYLLSGHEDGQLPFAAPTQSRLIGDAVIRDSLTWIDENYAAPNPVSSMTEQSGLTRRTFARRFVAATGRGPIDHVHRLRIERARDLIEGGDIAIEDVGYQVGYEDPAFFRRLFRRTTGLTPAAYRRKYAGIGTPAAAR